MKNFISLMVSLSLLTSCGHSKKTQEEFDQQVEAKQCEKALEVIPHENKYNKLVSTAETTTGTVLSYSVVGGAYAVQVGWNVGVGLVGIVLLCSPMIMAAAASSSSGNLSHAACFPAPADSENLFITDLPDKTRNKLKNLECPKIDEISQNIRKVASCYNDNNEKAKAEQILVSLRKQKGFFECLSRDEEKRYWADIKKYEARTGTN